MGFVAWSKKYIHLLGGGYGVYLPLYLIGQTVTAMVQLFINDLCQWSGLSSWDIRTT